MGKVEAAALIVGILMPLLVTIIKQSGLSHRWNLLVALMACAGAGVLTACAGGTFTSESVIAAVAIVFAAAQAAYQFYWRDSVKLEDLNIKTSIVK